MTTQFFVGLGIGVLVGVLVGIATAVVFLGVLAWRTRKKEDSPGD